MGCVRLAWHCGKMYNRYPVSYFELNRMLSPRVTKKLYILKTAGLKIFSMKCLLFGNVTIWLLRVSQ